LTESSRKHWFEKQELVHMPFVTYGRNVINHRCRDEIISQSAFFKWQAAGRPEGRDLDFWLAAEQEERGPGAKEELVGQTSIRPRPGELLMGASLPLTSERFSRAPRSIWPIT
jgi:hypothetical protein